jgi:hypothetical protein
MESWGRVVRALLVALAIGFAALGLSVAEARAAGLVASALCLAAGLAGVPALLRLLRSFLGDERLLESGVPGTATLLALRPTGWLFNRRDPVVRLELRVNGADGPPLVLHQLVPAALLPRLAPGSQVRVCSHVSDPRQVVLDWRQAGG